MMKLIVVVFLGMASATQFYAPPPGSPAELAAQESYFSQSAKIIVGLQEAYQWQNMGQFYALKAYKSGKFERIAHPLVLEESMLQNHDDEVSLLEMGSTEKTVRKIEIPAIPQNKELEQWMEKNSPKLLEEYGMVDDVSEEHFDSAISSAKVAALKFMQIQTYMTANDVQKSYWSSKLMMSVAPPELAYISMMKTFLSTVSLSVMMQVHDSYTLESYLESFNNDFNQDGLILQATVAHDTAAYKMFSSWNALAGIKLAMMYIDYVEMSTTQQVMQAAGQQMLQFPQPAHAAADMAATSLLETELKTEPIPPSSTGTDTKFTSGADPAGTLQQIVTLQYYTSLLKLYNMLAEFQLAGTGSTVYQYKLISTHILTNGRESDDSTGLRLAEAADTLDSIWLPQMFVQWGQINVFLQLMEAYQMYAMFTLQAYMPQYATQLAGGGDFQAQMQSVQANNAMEGMPF